MEPTIYKPSIYKGAGIYKIGAEGGGGVLPENYKQAFCCRSNGNVELSFNNLQLDINDTYEIDFSINSTAPEGTMMRPFEVYRNYDKMHCFFTKPSATDVMFGYTYRGGSQFTGDITSYPMEYIIQATAKKRYCNYKLNGYNKTIDRGSDWPNGAITSFKMFSSNNADRLRGAIYKFIVRDMESGEIKANFIPAYNDNNVLGFYEEVTGVFVGDSSLTE